jgi:hypothetical protein
LLLKSVKIMLAQKTRSFAALKLTGSADRSGPITPILSTHYCGLKRKTLDKQTLIGVLHLKDPFGHLERPFIVRLAQISNSHPVAMVGGVDHLPFTQVDTGMSHRAAPAKEKQIPRKQLGEIHLASHDLPYPGLFSAGAGQIDLKPMIDELDKPGAIRGRTGL